MDAPHIEFPCDYPIKVIGDMQNRPPGSAGNGRRESRNGNYQSVRVRIVATGEDQLRLLHRDLLALGSVRMVL